MGYYVRMDLGKNLNARRPVADQSDVLPLHLHGVVPGGAVEEITLEGVKPRDGRPAPLVEDAGGVDEEVAALLEPAAVARLDINCPLRVLLIPCRADDLVVAVDVLPQTVLVGKVLEVGEDFPGAGVVGRPVPLGLERVGVVVCGNIAGAFDLW